MQVKVAACTVLASAMTVLAGSQVAWDGVSELYYSLSGGGAQITQDIGIQLVIDVGDDTDFTSMLGGMAGVGADTGFGGTHSSASDDVVINIGGAPATWTWYGVYGPAYEYNTGIGTFDASAYASSSFYFRWFDAPTQGAATEAGIIYNSLGNWNTPADSPGAITAANTSFSNLGVGGLAGSNNGSGWSTIGAVPEPGTMGLLALGLVTLAVRRKKRQQ